MIKAGFAFIEITPPVGSHKIGWLKDVVINRILDPLFARIAVFQDNNGGRAAIIQLDTLSIRWSTTDAIRAAIEAKHGFPGLFVMVAATHNHAGPATASIGDVKRDDKYIDFMTSRIVEGFGLALQNMKQVTVGFARTFEFKLSHNRRTAMRNGLSVTHGAGFHDDNALYIEGPIDPEVGVLAAKSTDGTLVGAIVNFACHVVHHGEDDVASGGFPEVMCAELAKAGCKDSLFLNGACGDISPGNPYFGLNPTFQEIGKSLANDAMQAIAKINFNEAETVATTSIVIDLPVRKPTAREAAGTVKGAQRFIDPDIYTRHMPQLLSRLGANEYQPAEVQAIRVGPAYFVSIPAEYFTEFGLYIKEKTFPLNTMVVSCANGMLGYIPTEKAFKRGGYESTLGGNSRMSPKAGQTLANNAIALVDVLADVTDEI